MSWQDIIATQNVPAPRRRRDDPEAREQAALVAALRGPFWRKPGDPTRVRFTAPANGVNIPSKPGRAKAQAMGLSAGCPDLLIFTRPAPSPQVVDPDADSGVEWVQATGVAIELKAPGRKPKTDRAGRFSGAEPHQREWLEALESEGWVVFVAYGCDDALMKLRELGYGV